MGELGFIFILKRSSETKQLLFWWSYGQDVIVQFQFCLWKNLEDRMALSKINYQSYSLRIWKFYIVIDHNLQVPSEVGKRKPVSCHIQANYIKFKHFYKNLIVI